VDNALPSILVIDWRSGRRDERSARFAPPWSVAEQGEACFVVRDHDGQ
jgi:hypothetical protein